MIQYRDAGTMLCDMRELEGGKVEGKGEHQISVGGPGTKLAPVAKTIFRLAQLAKTFG